MNELASTAESVESHWTSTLKSHIRSTSIVLYVLEIQVRTLFNFMVATEHKVHLMQRHLTSPLSWRQPLRPDTSCGSTASQE